MRSLLLSFAFACTLLTGCAGGSSPLPETDAAKGREALKTVLDTWLKGGAPDDLKAAQPPIIAHDPDWAAGCKLTKYEIAPDDKRMGVDLLLKVALTLSRADGKPQEKKVNFTVGIGSSTVVLRSE